MNIKLTCRIHITHTVLCYLKTKEVEVSKVLHWKPEIWLPGKKKRVQNYTLKITYHLILNIHFRAIYYQILLQKKAATKSSKT